MTEAIRIGDPAIEIRLRRNVRARRMVLRVSQPTGTPILTLPPSVSLSRARDFIVDQEDWIRRHQAMAIGPIKVAVGLALPYRGGALTIAASVGRTSIREQTLHVSGPSALVPSRVAAFLREAARHRCLAASHRHAQRLSRQIGRLTMRDTRGRWGSCTASGDIMFSWRLIMAPDHVLDYVAAHEVAHFEEMNHSHRFWAVVARLCPDHAPSRDWLRLHGSGIMAYDFTPAA